MPDAASLRKLAADARGPLPTNLRQVVEFTGSLTGRETRLTRGDDWRSIEQNGPIEREYGLYAGQSWHEDANGQVVPDLPDPGLATPETFHVTVRRVRTPIDAFVIATLNAKGSGSLDYFDRTSHHMVRRDEIEPNGTRVTVYDDFKNFDGATLAAHWHVHDTRHDTDVDYEVSDYAPGAVEEKDVAEPAGRRIVQFPPGVDRVVLPAHFTSDGHVTVRVMVGNRGLDFLLDSGTASIFVDPAVAAEFKLPLLNRETSSGNAGRYDTGQVLLPEMKVGSLTMAAAVAGVIPLGWRIDADTKLVGILGFDFLYDCAVTIDYKQQIVTAQRPGTVRPPGAPGAVQLAVRLGTQQPFTTATINGAIAERTIVDSGADASLVLFDYFQRRYPKAMVDDANIGARTARESSRQGAGGAFDVRTYAIADFALGTYRAHDLIAECVVSGSSYVADEDGLIGNKLLSRFAVQFDYPDGKIYLIPPSDSTEAKNP